MVRGDDELGLDVEAPSPKDQKGKSFLERLQAAFNICGDARHGRRESG